jgi:hypothetical protein
MLGYLRMIRKFRRILNQFAGEGLLIWKVVLPHLLLEEWA